MSEIKEKNIKDLEHERKSIIFELEKLKIEFQNISLEKNSLEKFLE